MGIHLGLLAGGANTWLEPFLAVLAVLLILALQ
jgi:hypothetical protein